MPISRTALNALLEQLSKTIGAAFMEDIRKQGSKINIDAMSKAINSGDLDQVMHAAGIREGAWNNMTEELRRAYRKGGVFNMDGSVPTRYGMEFNINNPRAEKWLKDNTYELVQDITQDQSKLLQKVMEAGMKAGRNPRTVALDITGRMGPNGRRNGGIMYLNNPQTEAVHKMRNELRTLNSNYFTRERRDRRFDPLVKKAIRNGTPLPAVTVQKLSARYIDRLRELRGTTIARTEALKALNGSAYEAMNQVIDQGLAPRKAVKRVWHHGGYTEEQRTGHATMGSTAQTRGMDELFVNPETGAELRYPGDGPPEEAINCRCWVEHVVDFIAVDKVKPGALPGVKPKPVTPPAPPKPKPAPKAKPPRIPAWMKNLPPQQKGGGLNLFPNDTVVKQTWMADARLAGVFDTPRLTKLVRAIDDPKRVNLPGVSAHYDPWKRAINMQGRSDFSSTSFTGAVNRGTLQHEWGHFLDHQLHALLHRPTKPHPLTKELVRLCGTVDKGTSTTFLSSVEKPVAYLNSDGNALTRIGNRICKKMGVKPTSVPGEVVDLYTHDNIVTAWEAYRGDQVRNTVPSVLQGNRAAIRKQLSEVDNTVGRVYREIANYLGPYEERMFLEAAQTNDLSILFHRQGTFLKELFRTPRQREALDALSDLIGAANRERAVGGHKLGAGHGTAYYAKNPNFFSGTEAFANMTAMETERVTNKLLDELIKQFVPRYSKWYDDLMDMLNKSI